MLLLLRITRWALILNMQMENGSQGLRAQRWASWRKWTSARLGGQVGLRNQRRKKGHFRAREQFKLKLKSSLLLSIRVSTEGTLTTDGDFNPSPPWCPSGGPWALTAEALSMSSKCSQPLGLLLHSDRVSRVEIRERHLMWAFQPGHRDIRELLLRLGTIIT